MGVVYFDVYHRVSGAVAVLVKQGASAVELAAPRFPMMRGITPQVRVLDLDADRRPEVIVSFSSAQGASADWVLRWDGTTLKPMGPDYVDEEGYADTLLGEALFIDLDGDGVLEIVNSPDDPDPDAPAGTEYEVYALANGKYSQSKTLTFFDTFARPPKPPMETKGKEDQLSQPEVVTRDFVVADATVHYVMTIVNGDDTGDHRVTSAEITLNGIAVAGPETLGGSRRIVAIPVTAALSNTIRAVLRGPRDTWLTIAISPVAIEAK